jgi:hypothetical protein
MHVHAGACCLKTITLSAMAAVAAAAAAAVAEVQMVIPPAMRTPSGFRSASICHSVLLEHHSTAVWCLCKAAAPWPSLHTMSCQEAPAAGHTLACQETCTQKDAKWAV